MGRRLMRAALALTPVALLARYGLHAGASTEFVLSAAAMAPLAFLIGEATESIALHTKPAVGALANASFGNAPELIVALVAVSHGLPEVVRGSITGSVVSTSLLVCGAALLFGGGRPLARRPLLYGLGTILVAVVCFLVPAVPALHGDPERHELYLLTLPVAAVLLCLYLVATAATLRDAAPVAQPAGPEVTYGLRRAAVILAGATAATAWVSELVVGSLEHFGRTLDLSPFFVAAVIVALVGNAAEQGGAVVIARRGNPGLGAAIATSSASQVAVFVCPLAALCSGLLGHDLPLSFRPVELATMGGAAIVGLAAFSRDRAGRTTGLLLVGAYAACVVAFELAGSG